MKAFRFRLESVLTLRSWEEERARTAYGLALQQERKFMDQLRVIEGRIEQDANAARQGPAGNVIPGERAAQWRHLLALERERTDTTAKLATARRIREQKMKVLLDTHRRVEILNTLKTRQKQGHAAEALRRDQRELDELVSARFQPGL